MDPVIHLFEPISPAGFSAKVFQQNLAGLGDVERFRLRLHSEGGDILHGFSIYNQMLVHPAHIVAEVQILAGEHGQRHRHGGG